MSEDKFPETDEKGGREMKNYGEPWSYRFFDADDGYVISDGSGFGVLKTWDHQSAADDSDQREAERACLCVNACAGLNPEGIKGLVDLVQRWSKLGYADATEVLAAVKGKP
jgi:hypothetical protein